MHVHVCMHTDQHMRETRPDAHHSLHRSSRFTAEQRSQQMLNPPPRMPRTSGRLPSPFWALVAASHRARATTETGVSLSPCVHSLFRAQSSAYVFLTLTALQLTRPNCRLAQQSTSFFWSVILCNHLVWISAAHAAVPGSPLVLRNTGETDLLGSETQCLAARGAGINHRRRRPGQAACI